MENLNRQIQENNIFFYFFRDKKELIKKIISFIQEIKENSINKETYKELKEKQFSQDVRQVFQKVLLKEKLIYETPDEITSMFILMENFFKEEFAIYKTVITCLNFFIKEEKKIDDESVKIFREQLNENNIYEKTEECKYIKTSDLYQVFKNLLKKSQDPILIEKCKKEFKEYREYMENNEKKYMKNTRLIELIFLRIKKKILLRKITNILIYFKKFQLESQQLNKEYEIDNEHRGYEKNFYIKIESFINEYFFQEYEDYLNCERIILRYSKMFELLKQEMYDQTNELEISPNVFLESMLKDDIKTNKEILSDSIKYFEKAPFFLIEMFNFMVLIQISKIFFMVYSDLIQIIGQMETNIESELKKSPDNNINGLLKKKKEFKFKKKFFKDWWKLIELCKYIVIIAKKVIKIDTEINNLEKIH